MRGAERLKNQHGTLHGNQKPLSLTERLILASSEPKDIIWEPFGGLATAALAAALNDRSCFTAEISHSIYLSAVQRLRLETQRLAF